MAKSGGEWLNKPIANDPIYRKFLKERWNWISACANYGKESIEAQVELIKLNLKFPQHSKLNRLENLK